MVAYVAKLKLYGLGCRRQLFSRQNSEKFFIRYCTTGNEYTWVISFNSLSIYFYLFLFRNLQETGGYEFESRKQLYFLAEAHCRQSNLPQKAGVYVQNFFFETRDLSNVLHFSSMVHGIAFKKQPSRLLRWHRRLSKKVLRKLNLKKKLRCNPITFWLIYLVAWDEEENPLNEEHLEFIRLRWIQFQNFYIRLVHILFKQFSNAEV